MPDYWSVPIVPGVLTDLNSQIAKGPDLSWINTLADNYFKGKDQRFVQDQRDVFKNGLPRVNPNDPNSAIDYGAMVQNLAKVQGTAAAPMITELMKLQNAKASNDNAFGRSPVSTDPNAEPSPPINAIVSPSSATSIPSRPPPQANPAQPLQAQPINGYRGGNDPTSVISVLGANGVPDEKVGALAIDVANKLGKDPNEPLDMNDTNTRQVLADAVRSYRTANANPVPSGLVPSPGVQPQAQPTQAQASPSAAAPLPGGPNFAQRFTPVPTGAAPTVAPPPAAPSPGPTAPGLPSSGDPTLGGLIPQNWVQRFGADAPGQFVNYLSRQIGSGVLPAEQAKTFQSRIDAVQKAMSAASEPTPAMKDYANAVRNGFVGTPQEYLENQKFREMRAGKEGEQYAAQYNSIVKAGNIASVEKPKLEIVKDFMNDPNFNSGPASDLALQYRRWLSVLGGDPNQAVPQEGFRKVISDSILQNIRSMAGTGQIRVAEIRIMEKAAASADNSPAGNRLLVEIASRLYDRDQALAGLARNYNGGHLDSGFDKVAANWDQQHPLFSSQETKDPRLIAPPVFKNEIDLQKSGLPPGAPFKTPDGRVKLFVPRQAAPPQAVPVQ